MSHEIKPKHMDVADLAHRCAQETQRYFQRQSHDSSYCFELFRRAIQERDQVAWETICVQYQPLVSGWVKQHPGFQASGEEIQYFANAAFGKISSILTPNKFDGFSDIGSLLRYLKMCVHSVIVDHNRLADQANILSLEEAPEEASTDPATEKQVMDRAYRQAFWDWIDARLHDEKERSVMQGIFILALKPRELYRRSPHKFSDIDEIYRIKQNILARLGRDTDFRRLFGEDD